MRTDILGVAFDNVTMAEAVDRAMVIGPILLLEKSGGKSGDFIRPKEGE